MEVTRESVLHFRPGAPCLLAGVPASVYFMDPLDISPTKRPPFRTRVTLLIAQESSPLVRETVSKTVEVSWQLSWASLSICGAIAKAQLVNRLANLCLRNPYSARDTIFLDAHQFVVANLPLAIAWSLIPLRLSNAPVAKRLKEYRERVKELRQATKSTSLSTQSQHYHLFFAPGVPPRSHELPREKPPSGYDAQNLHHIVAKFLPEKNQAQVDAVQVRLSHLDRLTFLCRKF